MADQQQASPEKFMVVMAGLAVVALCIAFYPVDKTKKEDSQEASGPDVHVRVDMHRWRHPTQRDVDRWQGAHFATRRGLSNWQVRDHDLKPCEWLYRSSRGPVRDFDSWRPATAEQVRAAGLEEIASYMQLNQHWRWETNDFDDWRLVCYERR